MTFCNNLRKKNPHVVMSMEHFTMKLWLKTYLCSSEFLYTSVKSILRLASFAADVTSNIQVAGL